MELSQVLQALRNADAAGDVEGARRLAQIAQELSAAQPAPAPAKAPEESLIGSAIRGTKSMIGSERTGLASLLDANKAATEGVARQREIAAQHPSEDSWERVKKAYEEKGLLSAVGEYGRQIPYAIAEQTPQLAQSRLGAAAGAATPIPGGALAGAFAPAFAQQYGSFLEEQAKQQQEKGQPVDVSRLKAAAAAVPAAAIDVLETFVPMGKSAIKSLFPSVAKLLDRGATKEAEALAMKELASESFLKTLGKGTVRGAAVETPGEVAQQMLQRAQSGQSLFDEDALADYGRTAFQTTQLGPLGAVGRFQDKSAARAEVEAGKTAEATKERVAKAKEAEAATAAEEAKKQTPDYAKEIGQQYDTLFEQFKTQKAALKAPGKDASPVEKAEYKDAQTAVKELNDQLQKLVPEYRRTAPLRAQEQEKQRVAGLSNEDYMLEQMGQQEEGMRASGRKRRGALYDVEAAPVDTSLQDYATGQLEAASNAGALGIEDRVAYLMQDPTKADQMVQTRTQIPGVPSKENNAILGALKLQLKAREKETAAQEKEAAAQAERVRGQLGGAAPGSELMGAARQSPGVQAAEEARLEEEARGRKVNPEIEALQRIASKPAGGMDQYALEGMAQPPTPGVTPPENITPSRTASTVKSTVEKLIAERDAAEQERVAAAQAGEPAAAKAAANRAEEAKNTLSRISSEDEESAPYATAFVKVRNQQEAALFELEDAVDKLRRGAVLGGKATEEGTTTAPLLQKRANDLKKQYIAAALQEAALHRRALGQPAVTTDEATLAATQMDAALEELIVRMQAAPRRESLQEVITKPAQMRGTEIVSPAETEMRDMRPLEERRFGAPQEAVKVIQDQLAELREKLSNPNIKPTKVEVPLRVQSQKAEAEKTAEARGEKATTLSGELRRRTEYVRDKMAKMGGMRPAARDVLNSAADVMDAGKATRDLLDAVEPLVDAIVAKREIKQVDVRAVKDALTAISKQAQEGEVVGRIEGQGELFTERQDRARDDANLGVIRKNFENFQKSPPVLKARAAIAQAEKALKEAKAKEEKAAAQKSQKKQEKRAALKNAVEEQRRDLQQAVYDAMAAEQQALEQLAQVPIINAQKALEAAQKDLDALQEKINAAPDFAEKMKYAADLVKQREAITAAQADLDKTMAESRAVYDTATLVAAAHRDSLVQFERKALEKLEDRLAKERTAKTQTEAGAQRARVAKAENDARLANEKADKDRRAMEQRMMSGLGLEGVKRVAGEVAAIQSATDKAVAEGRKAAEQNREQGDEALTSTFELPQTARATSPVTRDVTRPGRLEESRKPKQTNVAIKTAEMEEANALAAEEKPAKKLTSRQQEKAAQLQKQELLEAKERLETGLRAQLADLNTRISALNNSVKKPAVELMDRLAAQKKSLEGQIVAARKDVELAGKEAQAVERELKKPVVPGKGKGVPDVGYLFSRGVPTEGLTTAELRNELRRAVGDEDTYAKKVSVFASVDEFLQEKPEYDGQIPSDAKAFVDPDTGRAYMFAENIGKNEGMGILLHEVGVHIGFRNFFNAAQFAAIAKTVRNWASAPANTLEGKIGRAAEKRAKEAGTSEAQMDDELIAYAVEEAVKAGVEPAGTKGGSAVANWLRMVVNAFNKALTKMGIAPEKLKVGDLVNMAYGAAQLELKGTWHGTGKLFTEFDHKYMGTGEGAQAFSWGTYRAETTGVANTYRDQEAKKQIDKWLAEPEMKAWAKSQAPTFGGKSAADFGYFARYGKPGEELAGVPFKFAKAMEYGLQKYAVDRAAMPTTSSALSPAVLLGIKLKHAPRDVVDRRELRAWLDTLDLSPTAAPHQDPLFRGKFDFEIADIPPDELSNEGIAQARTVLQHLEYPEIYEVDTSKPFAEQVKNVIAELKKTAERRANYEGNTDTIKEARNAGKAALEGLAELKPEDFVYNPPTPAPLPKPTGVMLRTLHGRKESEYLQWDLPWADQPKSVTEAAFKAIKTLNDEQQAAYDRTLAPLINADRTIKGKDVYDALSSALESEKDASELLHKYGVAGTKFLDRPSRNKPITEKSTYNYVDYADKEEGAAIVAANLEPVGPATELLFSKKAPKYANDGLAEAGAVADKLIAKQRTVMDTVKTEGLGLGLATRLVDRFAPLEKISKLLDSVKGTQMMYYARMYDQRMHFVAQAVGNGAKQLVEKTRADGRKEWVVESKEGASLKGVVDILKTAPAGSPEANNRLFSLYLAAKRAERVGLAKLNYGGGVTQADLDSAMAAIEATPGLAETFADAQREYNAYNKGLIQFAVDTGALSKEAAAEMTKANDYVPYYRANNGSVEMMLGKETITRVGSLKEQPYLKELVGGDEQILDFMTSSVQNTNMLTDMALRNLATKNAVFELQGLGMATVGKGSGASGPDVVKFKVDGQERFAIVDTQEAGFPGELLVKGLEGIPTQTTWLTKAMGGPARILRKAVVLNPMYAARQIFRDSLAAPLLSGADFAPVMGALKQIGKPAGKTLEQRGIVGGQLFTGTQEDLTKVLRDMSENKAGWAQGLARLEAMSMEADALTRRAQYDSYIKQGLSEMEATYMALESMNFSKRGASPAMHTLSTVIPFFNAQVQSLNVLYKAMSGNMPFNEKLKIREKLLARGMVVAGMSMLYAALMQDDDTYKNATPEQKYGNWFIHVPGVEEAVRVPIPFEVGYIFKALPEAIVNTMMDKHGGEDAAKAFKQIALQLIPGGTSWGIPQALKPALEVALGKSTFTGRDLESAHEQTLLPGQRVRENTSALAAQIGSAFNVSPIKIDALIQGYTSTMGLAFVQALSFAIPTPPAAEKATGRMSETPIVGSLFQPKDAGGVINAAYDRMKEAEQVKNTFNDLVQKGKAAEAKEFLQNNLEQFALSGLATNFTSVMQKLSEAERAVKASNASPEKKREQLDSLRQQKIKIAQMARGAAS